PTIERGGSKCALRGSTCGRIGSGHSRVPDAENQPFHHKGIQRLGQTHRHCPSRESNAKKGASTRA
ncbi:MAG: hypothetical protein WBQ94_21120, partial [Terracidiphilus sp.]